MTATWYEIKTTSK